MIWVYKATGNMTLSVVEADTQKRVFSVDMLSAGTMKAGTDGDRLVKAINDLSLLALIPELVSNPKHFDPVPFSVDHSPFPWEVCGEGRQFSVRDGLGRKIAVIFRSKGSAANQRQDTIDLIRKGRDLINMARHGSV